MRRRRIYESDALQRDEDDPFAPGERDHGRRSSIDWAAASHAFFPSALRARAIDVSIATNGETYAPDDPIAFRVEMRNRLPFPVVLRTRTPVRWTWAVDGVPEADHVGEEPPAEATLFSFARSERKVFERRWPRRFRETETEWRLADPGAHTISAWVNVDDARSRGLYAETTIELDA